MTVDRCPACRGRLTPEPACPRCGCDLELVRRAEAQARQRLVHALHAWALGDAHQARALAQASLRLAHSPLAACVLQVLGPA
ncbi:MAG: hypothetical protein Q8M01_00215 [Rubrivivax sp.]|nr:hypothetical protein [Rubrivivax sp.]